MRSFASNSPSETERIAEMLAKRLVPGDIVAFHGGLGAGKTAFTRGLARGLNVYRPDEVASPTFTLLNVYDGPIPLYHFDMYRVTGYDALESTGFFDYLDGEGVLAVEWSENIADDLPCGAITITIAPLGETARSITVEGGGRF